MTLGSGRWYDSSSSSSHADARSGMTAMQIGVMNDAVLDAVARALDFQCAVHSPLDRESLQDVVFARHSQILLHLERGLAVRKDFGRGGIEETAVAHGDPAAVFPPHVAATKLQALDHHVAGVLALESCDASLDRHLLLERDHRRRGR